MTLAEIAYIAQRFQVCYWARAEAQAEGRPYSDRLYRC